MSRIGSIGQLGSAQLGLLRAVRLATEGLAESSLRLATLKKINRAADNPSGLVMALQLESELNTAIAASSNVTRAQGLVSTADAAAGDIVSKLEDARVLALEVAGGTLSPAEVSAKQAELDDILQAIDRTAQTQYNGTRLLDGTSGFRVSGVDATKMLDVDVIDKRTASSVTVNVTVSTPGAKGAKSYAGGALGADATLEITGSEGTATIELASGSTTYNITDAFNDVTYLTGVTATRIDATTINFSTTEYGSAATIAITPVSGTFTTTGTGIGTDAVATVNGTSFTAAGLALSASLSTISLEIDLSSTASGALTAFTVSGSGLEYRLSTNVDDTARIGLANMTVSSLGGPTGRLYTLKSGGDNSLTTGDPATAIQILDEALSEALLAQARIGAFESYTLDSAANILDAQQENLSAAYSSIMEVDVPEETAWMTRQQAQQEAALQAMQIFTLQSRSPIELLMGIAARL